MSELPEVVVFDLDYTLWDCETWVDCTRGPYRKNAHGATDRDGRQCRLYPHVMKILDRCDELGITMALASRTDAPKLARDLLKVLGVHRRFAHQEIYPGDKKRHLGRIARAAGTEVNRMLFFDDEFRNIESTREIGATAIYTPHGMNLRVFEAGLQAFAER